MKLPDISVVIPVYNTQEYLEQCLFSIQNQTLQNIEIICVDDGSTDNSLQIIERHQNKDERIRIITKKNTGYGNTMNIGIQVSRGKYIAFVESDDWIRSDMLANLLPIAEAYHLDCVRADFEYFVIMKNEKLCTLYTSIHSNTVFYDRVFCPMKEPDSFFGAVNIWTGIYNREFIITNHIQFHESPGASYQDNGFWFQTYALANRVMLKKTPFYMCRRDNPYSSIRSTEKVYATQEEYQFIYQKIDSINADKELLRKLCNRFKVGTSFFTLERIEQHYIMDYLKSLQADYYEMAQRNELDWTIFSKEMIEKMLSIVLAPVNVYKNELERRKRKQEFFDAYPSIIIYGAGVYGKNVYQKLFMTKEIYKIICFAVSSKDNIIDSIGGLPVKEITELPDYEKENAALIVSAKESTAKEMADYAASLGYKNIMFSKELKDF
jgi:glycosyltransferase involved in cell wall biosynthesis